jgi:hypothetical protein
MLAMAGLISLSPVVASLSNGDDQVVREAGNRS